MDFGALPPEINSGRMYCGPGSGPMLAAAAAWDGVAVELGLAATGYASVIAELTGAPWVGAASLSMVAAATPYVAWLSQAAARAEQAGMQAAAAAAAYEAAFVMTVPPPVITANRVLVMTLIATNFFGQNSAAIAVAEAQYAEMWAQDAVAMYGYAAASASASRLIPFAAPPKTTNSVGWSHRWLRSRRCLDCCNDFRRLHRSAGRIPMIGGSCGCWARLPPRKGRRSFVCSVSRTSRRAWRSSSPRSHSS